MLKRSRARRKKSRNGARQGALPRSGDFRALLKRARVSRRLMAGLSGSLRTRGFLLWVAALLTGILCVSQHVYSAKLAEQIVDLRGEREEIEAEIGFLSLERARLSGRERIEQYAAERLGMRYPEAHEVVRLGAGTSGSWDRWGDDLVEGSKVAVDNG